MDINELIKCKSKKEVCDKLGLISNGYNYKKVNEILINNGLTIDYFSKKYYNEDNPPRCLECNNILPKNKRRNKFCNSSCSAKFNNKKRNKNNYNKKCLNCGKNIKYNFCNSSCYAEYNKKILFEKIENNDISHLTEETARRNIKAYLIEKHGEKCMKCGWNERHPFTDKVPIQLNHIDGNSSNNKLTNVEIICPNCHSLTPTYGALNKGNGRTKRREYRQKQQIDKGFII